MNRNSLHSRPAGLPRTAAAATRSLVLPALTLLALAGCESDVLQGPPELRLGRDECAECGMLISEDRCAAALLIEDRGRREHLLFDDIGCLLDLERDGLEPRTVVERFARDYAQRGWVATPQAHFLLTDPQKLITPMASGLVAFAQRDEAEQALAAHGGKLLDFNALSEARRAWLEQRRRPSSRPAE